MVLLRIPDSVAVKHLRRVTRFRLLIKVVLSRKESQHCLVVIILLLEVTITTIKGRYLDNVAGQGVFCSGFFSLQLIQPQLFVRLPFLGAAVAFKTHYHQGATRYPD